MKSRRTKGKYILDKNGNVVPEPDLLKWARWLEDSRDARVLKQEWVSNIRISTIFLGLDHNFCSDGPPIVWETMLFSNMADFQGRMWRCAGTREQAEAQHEKVVQLVKDEIARLEK
jgi:hypothetical protein